MIKSNTKKISKKLKENQEHNPKHSSPKTIKKHATSNFWTHKHTPQTNKPKTSSLICFLRTKSSTTNSPWSSNLSHQHLIGQQETTQSCQLQPSPIPNEHLKILWVWFNREDSPPPPHTSQPSESVHTFANIKQPKIYCKANKTNKSHRQLRNGDFSDSFQTDPSTVALFWHFLHFSWAAIYPSTIACFGPFSTFIGRKSIQLNRHPKSCPIHTGPNLKKKKLQPAFVRAWIRV